MSLSLPWRGKLVADKFEQLDAVREGRRLSCSLRSLDREHLAAPGHPSPALA